MELVQILLPLRDGQGRAFPSEFYDRIASEMTERFGGVTAYTRTPAEGRWKPAGHKPEAEDVVVLEIMVATLEREWWAQYRRELESTFRQKNVIVRAQAIQQL
jgi:hypothetical protein